MTDERDRAQAKRSSGTHGATKDKARRHYHATKGRYSRAPWPEPSPFAHLLTAYAYEQRTRAHPRPLTTREIADSIGYSRVTVNNWITHGVEPPLDTMLDVIARLGIPVARLISLYAQAMTPTAPQPPMPTNQSEKTEMPRIQARIEQDRAQRDQQRNERERLAWEESLRTTERTLREAGLTDTDVHRVISHMRRTAEGRDPIARAIRAEFTLDPASDTTPTATGTADPDNQSAPTETTPPARESADQDH